MNYEFMNPYFINISVVFSPELIYKLMSAADECLKEIEVQKNQTEMIGDALSRSDSDQMSAL